MLLDSEQRIVKALEDIAVSLRAIAESQKRIAPKIHEPMIVNTTYTRNGQPISKEEFEIGPK